jgi:hypothetical protein
LPKDECLDWPPHTPVEVGQTLAEYRPLVLCDVGLHASTRAIDALQYAPGPIVCRVECHGEIIRGEDKLCSSRRTVLAMVDATETLRRFARLCALDVIHLWEPPGVVIEYLYTGDERLRVEAQDAVLDAAWAARATWATWAAARGARDAARDAVLNAARDAVLNAAWDAAWAARDVTRNAAWAARDAARAAARGGLAAQDATRERQNRRLEVMLLEILRGS